MVNNWYKKMKKIFLIALVCMIAQTIQAQHDKYGKWENWGGGCYLFADGYTDSYPGVYALYLYPENGSLILSVHLDAGAAPEVLWNYSSKPVVEMEMSFDGNSYSYFSFIEEYRSSAIVIYNFVISDRLRRTTNSDATNMIKQMTNKKTMNIRYRDKSRSGSNTLSFNLEGLEEVYELIMSRK